MMDMPTSTLLVHDADILTFARSGKAERERMISKVNPEQVPYLQSTASRPLGIRTVEQTDGLHDLSAEHIAEGADSRRVVPAISCDRVAERHASEDAQQTENQQFHFDKFVFRIPRVCDKSESCVESEALV